MSHITKTLILVTAIAFSAPAVANAGNSNLNARASVIPTTQPVRSFRSFDTINARSNVGYLLNRGITNYEKGRYGTASMLLHRVLRDDPRNALAHYYMGLAKEKQGNLRKAERHLKTANQTFNRAPQSFAALGRVYAQNGKPEQAQRLITRLDRLKNVPEADVQEAKNVIQSALQQ